MGPWQELVGKSEAELAHVDLAAMNVACSAGLPGISNLEYPHYNKLLDAWAKSALREIKSHYPLFDIDPLSFQYSKNRYRLVGLITVLQRDLGLRYDPRLIHSEDFFVDARNVFVQGVIDARKGTCSNLPVLVVSVGRRLGFPLRLVSAKSHLFARWESTTETFNIECTSLGFVSHPDDYYLTWPLACSYYEAHEFSFLRSKSPREELAFCLAARGHVLLDNLRFFEAADAYAWAYELQPNCRLHLSSLEATINRWRSKLQEKWHNRPFPPAILSHASRFKTVPGDLEATLAYLEGMTKWVDEEIRRTPCFAFDVPAGSVA
ncbi:MAG: transglutaminase-like domain-containing protein [Gemmataceae bacterium]|nr:transglutaminase-like domain-containing protein [Gemmataceae bacterium]MCI0740300.1 transglutaminase-like domain-containing protein [Gemmataceae bacterium]